MKEGREKIKEKVKRLKDTYNFRGPLHFTDFSNLNSIIDIGYLCSRNLCYANNIDFYDAMDEESSSRIPVKVKGSTRFYYVERNNYDVMQRLNIPVYLLFNEEILYLDLAVYTFGNAELNTTLFGTDFDFFCFDMDWNVIFDKREASFCLNGPVGDLFCSIKQSELLIDEPIPLNQLKNIIFRCNADYKRACNMFGKNKMFLIEPHMFFNDENYITDYNIIYNIQLDSNVFILHFSTNEPVKNDGSHEYQLYDINDELIRTVKVSYMESDRTDFHVEVTDLPCLPVKFKFWFYGVLCIEETIG